MGEWKLQVPVKLDPATVEQIDKHVAAFSPFCEGRSALVRVLVEVALGAITDGTLRFDLPSIQQVLSKARKSGTPKIVKRSA